MLPQNGVNHGLSFENGFSGLDAAQAKQMAALNAASQARMAQSRAVVGGTSSGTLHDSLHQSNSAQFSFQDQAMHRPQLPQNVIKDRANSFLHSLAVFYAKRNNPLPPAISGAPTPAYDPSSSPFKDIEPGSEPGSFRLAGKDINLFTLWSSVWQRGGMSNMTNESQWGAILAVLDLPERYPALDGGGMLPVLPTLVQIYNMLLLPFENMYRQNILENQKKAQAMRQNAPRPGQGPSNMAIQRGPNMGISGVNNPTSAAYPQASSLISSSSSSSTPVASNTTQNMNVGANLTAESILEGPSLDQDLQALKRKLEADELEGKRARQKTEPLDNAFPAGPASDSAAVGSSLSNASFSAQTPANSTMTGQPRTRQEPSRRKIEYIPLAREIDTYGGRDLKAIEVEAVNQSRRPLRELNEWGTIDIEALTMSIRSRLSTELSYALTTFTLLSTMKGQQPNTGFPINNCPDLLGEILDLLEDEAFGDVEDSFQVCGPHDDPHIITNRELIDIVYESETQPFASLERRQGSKHPNLGPRQRPANLILASLNIIRNLCIIPDNSEYMARQPRVLDLLLRLCGVSTKTSTPCPVSPALSLGDLLSVRKDTLHILSMTAPMIRLSDWTTSSSNDALRVANRAFQLIASYLVDSAEAVSPIACVQLAGVSSPGDLKPPSLADVSLEVFTRLGLPDGNRQVLANAIPQPSMWHLFVALIHRLPLIDADFQLLMRERWLSYIEKLALALYALAFLSPPELKRKVKMDRKLGFRSVMMRIIQKFLAPNNPEARQAFSTTLRRTIEMMKVIDDGEDSFDTSKSMTSTISFGMGYGEVGENELEQGTGLLGGHREMGWEMLLYGEVDRVTFAELESLIRVEY